MSHSVNQSTIPDRFAAITQTTLSSIIQVVLVLATTFGSSKALQAQQALQYQWSTFVGLPGGPGYVDGPRALARFANLSGVAVDAAGNVFVADNGNKAIRKISASGTVSTLAGGGSAGFVDGTGSVARFSSLGRLTIDKNGNLYVFDDQTIRKITAGGTVTTLAGSRGQTGSWDGPGNTATFGNGGFVGLTAASDGSLYVADSGNDLIRKVTPSGQVSTFAGTRFHPSNPPYGYDGYALSGAMFWAASGVTFDSSGNLKIADTFNVCIRKLEMRTSYVSTFAGKIGGLRNPVDGVGASAAFGDPSDIAADAAGNVYVADNWGVNLRKVTSARQVTTLHTSWSSPNIASTASGVVYGANNSRIVRWSGSLSTFAGSTDGSGTANGTGTAARFKQPRGMVSAPDGTLYIAESGTPTIRKVTPAGVVTTVVATGTFSNPEGMALNSSGTLFVADRSKHAIWSVDTSTGVATVFVGQPNGSGQLDGTGSGARFYSPAGLVCDANDNLFVADEYNHAIRKVTPAGVVTTFAGELGSFDSVDGTGSNARFREPRGLALTPTGDLIVADRGNHTVRRITPAGVVSTLAGSPGQTGSVDGTGSAARFDSPVGVAVDRFHQVFVTTRASHTVRRISPSGQVTTIGGMVGIGSHQDGVGTSAVFNQPLSIVALPSGDLLVADESNNRVARGVPLAPRLVIEQPTGTTLTSGTSTVDFGSVVAGVSKSLAFTFKNTGIVNLSNLNVAFTGTAAADFTLGSSLPATIAPGARATITIRYTPSTIGAGTAVMHIASNAIIDNPFDVNLTGTGTPGMAFQNSLALVNEEASSIDVPIIRTGNTSGAVSVRVNSTIGTASAADFGAVSNVLVEFADGEASKNVSVPITLDALAEANENFTLTLSDPQGGIALSTPVTTTIRIVDTIDTTKPAVVISTPASGAGVAESAVVNVTGTASDNKGVQKVQIAFNGGSYVDAITTIGATGVTATFTAPIAPVPGLNTVTAKSIDTRNNESLVVTRTFYYHVLRPLTIVIDGTGTVPLPIAAATYKVNFPYTIVAKPGTGQVFDGWTVNDTTGTNITAAMMELPTLTFTHREGLTLTAHFKPNPFTPSIIGTFTGLVLPSTVTPAPNGSNASNETVGWISANVLSTGAFTGTVKIDGLTLPMNGIFDNAGDARFGTTRSKTLSLARTTKPALEVALKLDMTGATSKLTGMVTQRYRTTVTAVSDIDADRAAYLLTKNAPSSLAGTSSKPYTLVFKHRTSQPGLLAVDYPQGDGYATGTIKTDGTVSISGKLADHTAITASAPLSKVNRWPIFAQLYVLKGSFSAWINVDESATDTDMTGSSVHWFRPYQATQWYPWGWGEGIEVDIIGAHYAPSPASVFSVPLPVDALNGNATLTFSDGGLSLSVMKAVNISSTNVATKAPATDASFTFTLTPSTGLISGTYFTHTDTTKPAWQGVLFQKGTNKAGYGYFMTVAPRVVDGTGESGAVKLLAR